MQAHFPRKSSLSIQIALLLYIILIVYASGYPFSNWRQLGQSAFDFLSMPFSKYWSWFDVITNVIGYWPLGFLGVLACYPLLRARWSVLLVTMAGAALSCSIEAIQTFLPSRVASNLDLILNTTGLLMGALTAGFYRSLLLERQTLYRIRAEWFSPEASIGLVLIATWPLAQIHPQSFLFGIGHWLPLLVDWLTDFLEISLSLSDWLFAHWTFTSEDYWLSEVFVSFVNGSAAFLLLLLMLRKSAPRFLLLILFSCTVLLVKSLATALQFSPENALVWATPAARAGLVLSALMIYGLAYTPPVVQRRFALLLMVIGLVIVNIMPPNPYFNASLERWVPGAFINFNGLAQALSLIWPLCTLWFLTSLKHSQD